MSNDLEGLNFNLDLKDNNDMKGAYIPNSSNQGLGSSIENQTANANDG